jgi:hypothetical protein
MRRAGPTCAEWQPGEHSAQERGVQAAAHPPAPGKVKGFPSCMRGASGTGNGEPVLKQLR